MSTRPRPALHFAALISLLTCLSALTWATYQDSIVNARSGCTVPKTTVENGDPLRPRWANGQQVRVVAYPNHFTGQEISTMDAILDEFEPGGRVGCAGVAFAGIVEEEFPLTNDPVGYPNTDNTLYLFRKPVSEI